MMSRWLSKIKRKLGMGALTPKKLRAIVDKQTTANVALIFDKIVLCTRTFTMGEIVLKLKVVYSYDLESSEETEDIQYYIVRHVRNSCHEGTILDNGFCTLEELPKIIEKFNNTAVLSI